MAEAIRLKIEYMDNPLGIDIRNPRLTWNIKGGIQDGYSVKAVGHLGSIFISGVIKTNKMFCMLNGNFKSREQVEVSLIIYSDKGEEKVTTTNFEMGLFQKDFVAKWIDPELFVSSEDEHPASYLRKAFNLDEIGMSRIYATAQGVYNIYLNGTRVDGFIMAPGTSQYAKLLQYQTYDVTKLLQVGENEIIVSLTDGWWRGRVTYDGMKNAFGTNLALLLQLELNGEIKVISDKTWEATQNGPLRHADNMDGEIYDARLHKLTKWHKVKEKPNINHNLCCANCPPPLEHETFKPKLLITPNGDRILDFSQNITGYVGFVFNAKGNETLILTHGETLDGDGNFTTKNIQSPRFKCKQQVRYTCKPGRNIYKPTHTFMGFRYVKIESDLVVNPHDFTAYAVYTNLEATAEFSCGVPLVNQLFSNAIWSYKGNILDIPTDCPTREKSAFSGDIQVFTKTANILFDSYPLLRKTILNQALGQWEDGCVPQVIAHPRVRSPWDGAAGWSNSFEIVPYLLGKCYNDYSLFQSLYPQIKKWVDFLINRAESKTRLVNRLNPYHKYLVDTGTHWGEWLEPDQTWVTTAKTYYFGAPEVATAYFAYACQLLAKQAGMLGNNVEQKYYDQVSLNAKKAYRYKFFKKGRIDSRRMSNYVRPIILDILDDKEKAIAASDLNTLVIKNNYKLNTGFLTTHELLRVLSDYDFVDTAYKLLLNVECPGWLYSVKKGATTMLEHWDGIDEKGKVSGSFNHYAYGSVASWLIDSVCGIRLSDGEISIIPKPNKALQFARATYLSPFGKIKSAWEYKNGMYYFEIVIPDNLSATVILPNGKKYKITNKTTYKIKEELM